jgi:hypothetical protein
VVHPSGVQKDEMTALAGRIMDTDDPGKKIIDLIETEADEKGSYEKDVKPWLGERAGMALVGFAQEEPSFAVAVAATDTDAAADAIEREATEDKAKKATYKDVDYFVDEEGEVTAADGDFVLFTDSETIMRQTIDAQRGKSLAEAERFKAALDPLPGDRDGTFYFDLKRVLEQAGELDATAQQIFGALLGNAPPTAVAVLAEPDHLALESRVKGGSSGLLKSLSAFDSTDLIGEVPGEAWGAVGVPALGKTARDLMNTVAGPLGGAVVGGQLEESLGISLERDVFAWIGDVAMFVRGDSVASVDGGAIIAVTDEQAARTAVPKLIGALQQQAGLEMKPVSIDGASLAFELGDGTTPKPIVVALAGKRAVIAYGREAAGAALKPASKLSDSDVWDRAGDVLDGLEPSLVLNAQTVVKLIEQGAAGDPSFAEAKPYLDSLEVLAIGSSKDGDVLRSRFAVGVGD